VQVARMGTIVYLLALAMAPLTGWSVPSLILLTGGLATVYTMAGGMKAVVWVGVMQSLVLVAGTALCLFAVVTKTSGGVSAIVTEGMAYDKFSLGSFGASLAEPTFWVVFAYGLVINLGNFGADQSYVQRYIAARSDRDAARSVWITTLFYVPSAAVFFFIGTALFVFYRQQPAALEGVAVGDQVFPHFITTQLPKGLAGLVVAAIFAASLDLNLNNMATLTLCDVYKRYLRPAASERESLHVLRLATLAWGVAGTGMGLWMIQEKATLDRWWELAGLFSGGIFGLFLLGLVSRRAGNAAAQLGVLAGVLTMAWLTLPKLPTVVTLPEGLQSSLHPFMTVVVGTLVIFFIGLLASTVLRPRASG
jgi:SSS family solute:Na+ symporter